jgi:hypothetical protein
MSGMALATAGAIAVAPVSPVTPDFARQSAHEFISLPIRADQVELTGAIVDLLTNATVALIDLYYPVRNAGQVAIDVANAIVYNPIIQVWPITAWMSQINAAWYLGTGILDDTPPGAGVVQLLVDAVQIPQNVLNGASLSSELSHLGDLSLNALNYSAAYLLNYGFYQLAYFTWIWISPITPPLFPLLPSSVEFKLPGFLTPEAPSGLSALTTTDVSTLSTTPDSGAESIPASVTSALAPAQSGEGIVAADAVTTEVETASVAATETTDSATQTPVVPEVANTTETVPVAVDGTAHADVATTAVTKAPHGVTKRVVADQDTVSDVDDTATTVNGHGPRVRESVVTVASTVAKGSAAEAKKTENGVAEHDKQAGESATTNSSSDQG